MARACSICQLVFPEPELELQHFKTEWHRFNLKRKMAEQPAVSLEEYEAKFANKDEQKSRNELNAKANQTTTAEQPKTSMENAKEQEVLTEEVDSDDDIVNPIDENKCLFCDQPSTDFYNNLEHMSLYHCFFIPYIEDCVDIKGLLRYLGAKISQGYMCVWCNHRGRTFYSADAAKAHMLDKGHTNMIFEGVALAEYNDFYDYSTSYPDAGDNVAVPELDWTGFQLILPSGKTIGHRSLLRYYRQSLNPNRAVAMSNKSDKKLHKVFARYMALGRTESDQAAAARRAKDIHCLKRIEAKNSMKLGIRGNKLQAHFRPQIRF